jgi:urease accessory protein
MLSELLIVARMDRQPHIECHGGLAARRTERHTVHLVSAAATPLGGDTLSIRVVVEAGARLVVRSAAATMALPGTSSRESRATWDLQVAGDLDLDPQPTIVAGGSRHVTSTRLTVTGGGTARIRERAQIGRSTYRCCAIASTWAPARSPTTHWARRGHASANCVIRNRLSMRGARCSS